MPPRDLRWPERYMIRRTHRANFTIDELRSSARGAHSQELTIYNSRHANVGVLRKCAH